MKTRSSDQGSASPDDLKPRVAEPTIRRNPAPPRPDMQSPLVIKSIGPPPELHADRVVAAMLRQVAQQHADIWAVITKIAMASSTGSPKAQEKLAHRINKTEAFGLHLQPGKRGEFLLRFFTLTGWDLAQQREIEPGDPIPPKPWLVCHAGRISSEGRGANTVACNSSKFVFITHHVCCRGRRSGFETRTIEHLIDMARVITCAAVDLCAEKGGAKEALAQCNSAGYQVRLDGLDGIDGGLTVVLTKHRTQEAFVALTMY